MTLTRVIPNSSCVRLLGLLLAAIAAAAPAANGQAPVSQAKTTTITTAAASPPPVAEAEKFISQAETRLLDLWIKSGRASWVSENFITDDTESISADAEQAVKAATSELATQAKRYEKLQLPPDVARKFKLLKLSVDIPAPRDPAAQAELSKIDVSLDADYGKGTWCPDDKKENCKQLPDIEKILASSRDPKELLSAWQGWHAIAPPMRKRYARMVELSNQGAREMGFADVGAMWRSGYDMPPADFARELDRLWEQVRPLYVSLHAYTRWKLAEKYGKDAVREDEPIPAHLLGNMWSQEWNNIYPLLAPQNAESGPDVSAALRAKNVDARGMVRYAEGFFKSLGFEPLPSTFWERSLFTKPRDRDVVCHASAWSIDFKDDLRIKVCIEPTAEDFTTVHHELGHNFYQRAYNTLPPLFQNGANDGFHEAIGDTIALSVTPEYLKQIGLIETVSPPSADIRLAARTLSGQSRLSSRSACSWTSGAGKCSPAKSSPPITTKRGGNCGGNIRASLLRSLAARPISIPAQNITWPTTYPTRDIFWQRYCNFNFIAPCARKRDTRARCIAARFTETKPRELSSRKC